MLNQKQWYELVGRFFADNCTRGKAYTIHHFIKTGVKKRTIYHIISMWEQNAPIGHQPGKVRNPVKMPCRRAAQLVKAALLCPGVSYQKFGNQFGISHTYISCMSVRFWRRRISCGGNGRRAQNIMVTNYSKLNKDVAFWEDTFSSYQEQQALS